jgi:hypothetical protein
MSEAQAWEKRASRLCDKAYYDALKQSRDVGDEDPASVQQRTFRNLHGQIGDLCRDLACYEPTRDKHLEYIEVTCVELDCDVLIGVEYEPGSPGMHTMPNGDPGYPDEPPSLEVCEVWLNGADIGAVLMERVCEQLKDAAWNKMSDLQRDRMESDAAERYQAQRDERAYS